ncbi:hypothetical protein MK851_15410 [Tenacibaculum sp. 1B UA]|uniref:hypothetical protein n=1 Tax=Tenacibaculum sp. 1B UA TaxID=2922252 RepID=UPI002A246143|nr:hypothetical protein [Tenacibaculum sp. 1B UA]MDX8555002.1 hypothetical protein [Tenacibaculum sp. 1B UA]
MAKKIIVVDEQDKDVVTERIYRDLKVFEIPLSKAVNFHLKVLKAKNVKETKENVYWIAQSHNRFKTRKFRTFKSVPKNQKELHVLLNELNKGTKYGKRYILNKDGEEVLNPDFHAYTLETTGFVKRAYLATNPYKSHTEKREGVFFGNLKYIQRTLGKGIWLEGINYTPEFKEQGAFILAVDKPQVLSLLVERRTLPEKIVRSNPIKKDTCDSVEQELLYGDVLDIHMHLHNVLSEDYELTKEVFYKGESMTRGYSTLIDINIPKDEYNPSLDYNVSLIDEHVVNLSWAGKTNHKEAKDSEDSLQEYIMVFTFTPVSKHAITNNYPTIKREVTLTVNYKSDFSATVNEEDYVTSPNIVKVWQPPLITQLYEKECSYKELSVNLKDFSEKIIILKEEEEGPLTDNKIPYLEFVADVKKGVGILELQTNSFVSNCEDETELHKNNVFVIDELSNDTVTSRFFGKITPLKVEGIPTENSLRLNVAYPYEADNDFDVFRKYIFGGTPYTFTVKAQSCRYTRTPMFKIYPEMAWKLILKVGSKNPEAYSYTNMKDSSRTSLHNKRSRNAGINKKYKTREVYFNINLKATYGGETNEIINAKYEAKIKKVLEAIVAIKETMDNITGVTKTKKGMAAKMGGKLLKMPFTFKLDYPVISIEGNWKNTYIGNGVVEPQGSIAFGFTPLIKGTGTLDLLAAAEFLPVIGQFLKAANLVLLVAGVEIYFNLYGFGKIDLKGTVYFNQDEDVKLESSTTVGVGVELGVVAEANIKKITFKADKVDDKSKKAGFEIGAKGETSITIGGATGKDDKGPFIEMNADFNGVIVYVTAKVDKGGFSIGPNKKPYQMVEPKQNMYNKKWYLLED